MDIIMIPFHDCKKWIGEGFRTRDAHLAEHFCTDTRVGKVLVINRPTSFAESLLKRKNWRTSKMADDLNPFFAEKKFEITKLNQNLYCLDTFLPDFFKVAIERKMWWFSAFRNKFILNTINQAIEKLELENTVLLLQNPMAIGVIDNLDYKCFAFDAIDNWLHHPQMKSNHALIEKNYKLVEKKADVIFTVSKALTKLFRNNSNVYWIANGVDEDFFFKAVSTYNANEKITVGYVGKIQERVDFDLVEECLKKYYNMKFVFIGPVYSQKKRVRELKKVYPNIKFTGDVHYTKLPEMLKNTDIAIIPHKIDAFTESMNPLKLYEYLAAGKPVVTTGVAGTDNISKYVYTANDAEFVEMLGRVATKLMLGTIDSQDVAHSIPYECTWTFRTKEIIDKLEIIINK